MIFGSYFEKTLHSAYSSRHSGERHLAVSGCIVHASNLVSPNNSPMFCCMKKPPKMVVT